MSVRSITSRDNPVRDTTMNIIVLKFCVQLLLLNLANVSKTLKKNKGFSFSKVFWVFEYCKVANCCLSSPDYWILSSSDRSSYTHTHTHAHAHTRGHTHTHKHTHTQTHTHTPFSDNKSRLREKNLQFLFITLGLVSFIKKCYNEKYSIFFHILWYWQTNLKMPVPVNTGQKSVCVYIQSLVKLPPIKKILQAIIPFIFSTLFSHYP